MFMRKTFTRTRTQQGAKRLVQQESLKNLKSHKNTMHCKTTRILKIAPENHNRMEMFKPLIHCEPQIRLSSKITALRKQTKYCGLLFLRNARGSTSCWN
jgi:hypothetical protein